MRQVGRGEADHPVTSQASGCYRDGQDAFPRSFAFRFSQSNDPPIAHHRECPQNDGDSHSDPSDPQELHSSRSPSGPIAKPAFPGTQDRSQFAHLAKNDLFSSASVALSAHVVDHPRTRSTEHHSHVSDIAPCGFGRQVLDLRSTRFESNDPHVKRDLLACSTGRDVSNSPA
jgi:hypothetical protein